MKKNSLANRILQHARRPEGFWGRMMPRSMDKGHAPLAAWGMPHVDWQPDWTTIGIGCGGERGLRTEKRQEKQQEK